ncbi:MAG: response regulator [Oculatellaceae cyanobacterium bins.114]|nr:response regulator [Oculatellaceae cyanobacterium bins.114]
MSKRILVIEDNHIHRLLTEDFFSHKGYMVKGLADGCSFLSTLAKFQPDLIVLDLRLPVVDGFTLLEQLNQSSWRKTPVIIVSAYSFEAEKQKAKSFGVSHYFTKPVSLEVLEQCVACSFVDPTLPPAEPPVD